MTPTGGYERDQYAIPPSVGAQSDATYRSSRFGDHEVVRQHLTMLPARDTVDVALLGNVAESYKCDLARTVTSSSVDDNFGEELALSSSNQAPWDCGSGIREGHSLYLENEDEFGMTDEIAEWREAVSKNEGQRDGAKRKLSARLSGGIVDIGRKVGRKFSNALRKDSGYASIGAGEDAMTLLRRLNQRHSLPKKRPETGPQDGDGPQEPASTDDLVALLATDSSETVSNDTFVTKELNFRFGRCHGNKTTYNEQVRASIAHCRQAEREQVERDREFRQGQERHN